MEQKNLSLVEIQTYLSPEKIEEILTNVLIHKQTEDWLREAETQQRWLEHKEIYIYDRDGHRQHFSNENWIYYLERFRKSNPKILTMKTTALSDFSGIETITSLEEVSIGPNSIKDAMYLDTVSALNILSQILLLPNIQKISLACSFGGTIRHHEELVEKCLEHVQQIFPRATLDPEKNSFPFVFHLKGIQVPA